MAFQIISPGGAVTGGTPAWTSITGKPVINTVLGNPGSDSVLPSEKSVRDKLNVVGLGRILWTHSAPNTLEHVITDDLPAGTLNEATYINRSGTHDFTLKLNGVAVTGLTSKAVNNVRTTTVATAANTSADRGILSIQFANPASAVDFSITVRYTKTV